MALLLRQGLMVIGVMLLAGLQAIAQRATPLQRPYHPSFTTGTIRDFFLDIRRQSDVPVVYSGRILDPKTMVSLQGNEQTVGAALGKLLEDKPVRLEERRDKILIVPGEATARRVRQRTISGFVRDSSSREIVAGAFVSAVGTGRGAQTNNYGFFSLTVPAGSSRVLCEYPGYNVASMIISPAGNVRMEVLLSNEEALAEVTVKSKRNVEGGPAHLTYNEVDGKPAPLGESDVLRALQHQAGVQGGTEGTSSLLVRGCDPGQNLHLLDEVPLYNIDHFYGVTSVFNNEAIKSVDFHKGAFPARFGGRTASVVDVHTRDGNLKHWGGQASIGLLKAGLFLEAPVVKDRAAITVSARRTWLDALWRPITDVLRADFYDINTKANCILNKNNRLYVSFYNGRDQYSLINGNVNIDKDSRVLWGNTLASGRWTSVLSPKLFLNTTLSYTQFKYTVNATDSFESPTDFEGTSRIRGGSGKVQAQWFPVQGHKVEAGISYSYTAFDPVSVTYDPTNGQPSKTQTARRFKANEAILYLEDEVKLGRHWIVRPGLHWANWVILGGTNYSVLQPRLYAAYRFNDRHTLYASGSQMAQFLHLINNNTYGMPTDFWLPSTNRLKPETSLTGSIGYAASLQKAFSYNVEGYYRSIDNIITYRSGKTVFDNSRQWEQQMVIGRGWSYGLEVSVQKKTGPLLSTVAYTLSKTMRQFDALNGGDPFPFRYDRRHNLKADVVYEPSHRFNIAATFTYMSGEALTLPDQIYPDLDKNLLITSGGSTADFTYNYTTWNNYRLPAIHRLDFAANFTKNRKRTERTWTLGVYNVYARRNVMFVTIQESNGFYSMKGITALRFIPTITYRLKF